MSFRKQLQLSPSIYLDLCGFTRIIRYIPKHIRLQDKSPCNTWVLDKLGCIIWHDFVGVLGVLRWYKSVLQFSFWTLLVKLGVKRSKYSLRESTVFLFRINFKLSLCLNLIGYKVVVIFLMIGSLLNVNVFWRDKSTVISDTNSGYVLKWVVRRSGRLVEELDLFISNHCR